MNKQLIGVLRVVVYLVVIYATDLFKGFDLTCWISDLIHGDHTAELRGTTSVLLVKLLILIPVCFFIFQTLFYVFIGGALQDKNTSIFNFFRHLIKGIREAGSDSHFWTRDSGNNSDFNSIDKVLSYRDNKMAMMSNKESAKYMTGTGHLDMLLSRPDLKQSRKTLSYLNNKIAFMSNESALNYLKNNK